MSIEIAWAAVNLAASLGLAVAGFGALYMWRSPSPDHPFTPRLALLLGIVLCWFAIDEGIELHDRLGHWLWREHGVVAPGPVHHVDDLFLLAYLVAAIGLALLLLPSLLRRPWMLVGFVVAGALFALSTLNDAVGPETTRTDLLEESMESTAAIILAVALWRTALAPFSTTRRASVIETSPGDILAPPQPVGEPI